MNKVIAEILETPKPKDLTKTQLEALREAFGFFERQPKTIYSAKGLGFKDKVSGYSFNNVSELLKELYKIGAPADLSEKEIGILLEHWYESEITTPTPEYTSSGTDQNDSPQQPNKTTVTEKTDEGIFSDLERREKSLRESRERQKETVQKFKEYGEKQYKDKQVQSATKDIETDNLISQLFSGKKVVVVPAEEIPTTTLKDSEKEVILELEKSAKQDPGATKHFFEEKIKESLSTSTEEFKTSITPKIIEKSAVNVVEQLSSLPEYKNISEISDKPRSLNTLSIIYPLSNPESEELKALIPNKEAREKFADKIQAFLLAADSERSVNVASAKAIFGENIAYTLYGPDALTKFKITNNEDEQKEGVELDPVEIYKQAKDVANFIKTIRNLSSVEVSTSTALAYYPTYTYSGSLTASKTISTLTKVIPAASAVYGFKQGVILSQWARSGAPLLSAGNQNLVRLLTANAGVQEIASASLVTFSQPVMFQAGRFSIGFATGSNASTGTQIAVGFTKFGGKMTGAIAIKTGTQVTVVTGTQAGAQLAVGASTTLTKVLTFLGGMGSWATAGLSLVGGYLLGKGLEKINWAKVKKWFQDNKMMFGLGASAGVMIVFGPTAGLLAGLGFLALTGSLGVFAFSALNVFGFIGRSLVTVVATPVIVTALVIPPLVAFIMLIINNGAYIVPPAENTSRYASYDLCKKPTCTSDGEYCFPVCPVEDAAYYCGHHDYPAADIFRKGDKPGPGDDKPVTIVAYTAGTVAWTQENDGLGGVTLMIAGDDRRFYYYAHNERNLVKAGEHVEAGQPIALMGSTGNAVSTQEHVHFGISTVNDFVTLQCKPGVISPYCKTREEFEETVSHFILPSSEFADKLDIQCPYQI